MNPGVLVVGAGGLGCPALYGLALPLVARATSVTVVDPDRVELSNLQRQILHRTRDLGRAKVDAAAGALRRRFPELALEPICARFEPANARELIGRHRLVLDCTDGAATKFLLNDECVRAGVPLVHGGVLALEGQLMSIVRGRACLRCLFERPPEHAPSCQDAGVLGAVCGVIGGLMAEEAVAILDGKPELAGVLLRFGLRAGTRRVPIRRRPSCELCGDARAPLAPPAAPC